MPLSKLYHLAIKQNAIDLFIVTESHPVRVGNRANWWLFSDLNEKSFMFIRAPVNLCVLFKSYHLFQTQFKQVLSSDGTEEKWLLSCHYSELFSEIIPVSKFANLASFTKASI